MKASERGERRVHPTQKPVALAEWVIETAAPKAKTVLDLFVGSGSGLIAAERKNIKFFGMEMATAYVDVSVKRWQKISGREAVLETVGATFDEIARERGVEIEADPISECAPDTGALLIPAGELVTAGT